MAKYGRPPAIAAGQPCEFKNSALPGGYTHKSRSMAMMMMMVVEMWMRVRERRRNPRSDQSERMNA